MTMLDVSALRHILATWGLVRRPLSLSLSLSLSLPLSVSLPSVCRIGCEILVCLDFCRKSDETLEISIARRIAD